MWVESIPGADATPPSAQAHLGVGLSGSEMICYYQRLFSQGRGVGGRHRSPHQPPSRGRRRQPRAGAPRRWRAECCEFQGRFSPHPLANCCIIHLIRHQCECVSFFSFRENNTEQSLTFKNAMIFCHRYENLSAAYLILRCIEYQNKRY